MKVVMKVVMKVMMKSDDEGDDDSFSKLSRRLNFDPVTAEIYEVKDTRGHI